MPCLPLERYKASYVPLTPGAIGHFLHLATPRRPGYSHGTGRGGYCRPRALTYSTLRSEGYWASTQVLLCVR